MRGRKSVLNLPQIEQARLLVVLVIAIVTSLPAHGQRITGSITGTVKDQQGLVVTTATVKAANVDTGLTRTMPVNSDGEYNIQYLPVGIYSIEVVAPNFERFVQRNLQLTVDQSLVLNVTLVVGTQTQTITVTEAPPLVNTASTELGRTIQPAEIIGLPLVNRNAYSVLSLTPGVQSNSASSASNPSGTPNFTLGVPATAVIVNGGVDEGSPMVSYYLDGGENMTGLRNYGNPLPNPDALQEFRVETSNFNAQYGRMSGAVVTAVTKSGTNQFHGSLFEFNRNTDLNATPWNSKTNAPYHRNQFGGTVGGPIRHDKAFFFFSYAGLRQVVGQQLTGALLPTTAERLGDFTASNVTIYMPGTTTPVNGTNSSPGCAAISAQTAGKCIPQSLLDPAAANLMKGFVPLPNGAAGANGGAAYTGFFTGPTESDEYLGKFDQTISDKDHVAVSYFELNTTQDAYGAGNIPYSINASFARQQNVNISELHTIGSASANQAWFTYTRVAGGRVNLPTTSLGDLGSTFTIQGPPSLPEVAVSGYFSAAGANAGPVSDTDFYSVRDLITTEKGRHSLTFGGEGALDKNMFIGTINNFGIFTFATSAPTTTGNALADLITGQVATMEQDSGYHALMSDWYLALYIQDNIRLTNRLRLTVGLRYDLPTPPVESHNLTSTFVPGVQSTAVPSAPEGLLYVGDAGVTRGVVPLHKHFLSPRLGLVWDPFGDGKTAIRAGAGIFYGSVSGNQWAQPSNAAPFGIRQLFYSIASFSNVYGDPASFPNGNPFPYTYNPKSPYFPPAAGVETIAENFQWPLTYQLNFAIERQLPWHVGLTTAYVGSLSHHIPFMRDANYPVWQPGATTSQDSINARRPYDPGALGLNQYLESSQTTSYHSLQISATRPLSRNVMVSGFYVLSKSFESAVGLADGIGGETQDFDNLWEERGPSDVDQRQSAAISGMWQIDYFRGQNRILKQVFNGWTVSPIVSLHSGTPVNLTTGTDVNADGNPNSAAVNNSSTNRPNLVPGVSAFLDPHRSRKAAAAEWFNPSAFVMNAPGAGIGPGGVDGNTPRDYLRAPGYRDIDLGILRNFKLPRETNLELRAEATNAFNLVSLNSPTATLISSQNGKITSAASPRLIQVGARITF